MRVSLSDSRIPLRSDWMIDESICSIVSSFEGSNRVDLENRDLTTWSFSPFLFVIDN